MKQKKNRKTKTKNRRAVLYNKIREKRNFRKKKKTNNNALSLKNKDNKLKSQQKSMSYKFLLYTIFREPTVSPLELFINTVLEQVNDLSQLLEKNYATMQKEYRVKEAKIKSYYQPLIKELEIKYNRLFNKYKQDGIDERTASTWACHESGQDSLFESKEYELKELFDRNKTLKELFFKSMLISLYSIFESEVIRVVKLQSLPVKFDYKKDTKEINFFEKILVEAAFNELDYLNKADVLRAIRNSFVHGKSIFYSDKEKHEKALPFLKKNKNCSLEKNGVEYMLTIENIQFIKDFIRDIRKLLNQIIWAVDIKDHKKLLKSRIIFLLKYIDPDVTVEIVNFEYTLSEQKTEFNGILPSLGNKAYNGKLFISDKLDQGQKCIITSNSGVFDSLKKEALDFLYKNTLKGFLCEDFKQKVKLELVV